MRRDVHRLLSAQPTVLAESLIHCLDILRGGRNGHLPKQRIIQRFVSVKVGSRVVRAMKKPQEHKRQPACE